jgi:hypothetical protein
MSLGCFASALTRSQIIAAMNAFVMGLGLFVLSLRALMPTACAGLGIAGVLPHCVD